MHAQNLVGSPGEVSRIGAPGVRNDHPVHAAQGRKQLFLLLRERGGVHHSHKSGHSETLLWHTYCSGRSDCPSAPSDPFLPSSGTDSGITLAAATRSSSSVLTRRTPCVDRPACRISPDSMRMILPSLVTIIRSESSFTERIATTLPVFPVVFMLMTPLPPRAVSR